MSIRGALYVSSRIFSRNRIHGHPLFGAALGIALSLIPLVTVDHVAAGMVEGIIARYRETSSFHFQAYSWQGVSGENFETLSADISNLDCVSAAWTERQGFALARASGRRTGLTVRAVPPDLTQIDPVFAGYIEFDSGSWDLSSDSCILLGREAARELGVKTGETVRLLTARKIKDKYIPKVSRFTVKGIFSSGYQDLDKNWAFISLSTGWKILPDESSRTFIGGKFISPETDLDINTAAVAGVLPDGWVVYNWKDLNRFLLKNLQSTKELLLFIMALIIIVAVVNVVTSLVMLVFERQREIGILKCSGVSSESIILIFLFAGIIAAVSGIILGLSGGLLVSRYINEIIHGIESVIDFIIAPSGRSIKLLNENYYLQHIPSDLRWKETLYIGLATLFTSAAASLYPAVKAAGLKPLEVLRKH